MSQQTSEIRAKHYTNLKKMVMSRYGGICSCCGEDNLAFLTIDHINNNGAEERIAIGGGGVNFYQYLKRNGFPQNGYSVLCMNCNWGKRHSGICPHKAKKIHRMSIKPHESCVI